MAEIISGSFQIRIGIENNIRKANIVCHNPYFSIDTFISSTIGLKCSIRNVFPLCLLCELESKKPRCLQHRGFSLGVKKPSRRMVVF